MAPCPLPVALSVKIAGAASATVRVNVFDRCPRPLNLDCCYGLAVNAIRDDRIDLSCLCKEYGRGGSVEQDLGAAE